MNEVDEHGWAHIHQAAKKGYFKSVEKFIQASDDQIEFETQDDLKETPLMVAVRAGSSNMDTISTIIKLGGKLDAINNVNHGLVEICCMEGHTDVLDYLQNLVRPELPVWNNLIKFCASDLEEEAECAGKAARILTMSSDGEINSNWKQIYECGGVSVLVKVMKGGIGNKAKAEVMSCLINVLRQREITDQVVTSGGVEAFIKHLKSSNSAIVQRSATALAILSTVRDYAEICCSKGAISALVSSLRTNDKSEVLVAVVKALGTICEGSSSRQSILNSTPEGIESLCSTLENCEDAELLLVLCQCMTKIAQHHPNNQRSIVDCGGASDLIMLAEIKNREIQLAAVDTIHMLADSNPFSQAKLVEDGVIGPLINLLNKSKSQVVQEKTASALWSLAGEDGDERRKMALTMGVNLLIDFLSSLSEILHFIGSEGLGVLAYGAHNQQDMIAEANGVFPLVRLLKSEKEHLVLSAVRSIRHLCLGVGYLPHAENQKTVSQARGIKLLIALMILSNNDLIQVESALTMASVALGNPTVIEEVMSTGQHLQFSYVRILTHLYSEDSAVRVLAGAALATFAYNNMTQQQMIAAEGGVRFSCFADFLQSSDEYLRCNTAFQVVVLARIIPDEEQAVASAAGIKLLADILNDSSSKIIQSLASDCVARLAHTRAGVPEALVAMDCVERLCSLMYSDVTQVRGCAAIALGYLSYNHKAERQLLNRCRTDPYLIKCLRHYTDRHKISKRFKDEWKHYKKLGGLPAIQVGRPNLVSRDYRTLALAVKTRPQRGVLPDTPTSFKAGSVNDINKAPISRVSTATAMQDTSQSAIIEEQPMATPVMPVTAE
ncbi:ankyrin and armadillo repeat-containing protein-like [Watersipora subatra]|uniref:ankyrin and armadillo repeat-containing protein-like n=1 Tax=Watersipora subatra TaxID=2589382 RepID=UPI00355C5512